MVRGGPVGVAVKRRLRERGFEAGQALGERLFGSGCRCSIERSEGPLVLGQRSSSGRPTGS